MHRKQELTGLKERGKTFAQAIELAIKTKNNRPHMTPTNKSSSSNQNAMILLDDDSRDESSIKPVAPVFKTNFKENVNKNIVELIQSLMLAQDEACGIPASFHQGSNGSLPILFRDARDAKSEIKDSWHAYAIMGLQAWTAARKLAELAGVGNIEERFSLAELKQFYTLISKNKKGDNPAFDLAFFIKQIIMPELADALNVDVEEAEKRLHVAKEFCNFEFKPFAVATLTSHKNEQDEQVDMLHVDAPVYRLTKKLINVYKERQQQDWYCKQPDWVQDLIDAYADKIIEGRPIPTQLRKYLPGLRNAGHEVVLAFNGKSDPKDVYQGYHSGNLAHLITKTSSENNEHYTALAIKQLHEEVGHEQLHINTLITPIPVMGQGERDFHQQVQKAVRGVDNVSESNTPINILRPVAGNKLKGFKLVFAQVRNLLESVLDDQVKPAAYLNKKEFWDTLLTNLDSKPSSSSPIKIAYQESRCFEFLLQAALDYRRIKQENDARNDGNRNLELAAQINLIASYYNDCCEILNLNNKTNVKKKGKGKENDNAEEGSHDKFKKLYVDSPCKSGKDRAGLLRVLAVAKAISRYLGLESDNREVLEKVAKAGQVQRQAGMTGATLGAQGFVASLIYTLPDRCKELKEFLLLASAKYNKHYPGVEMQELKVDQKDRLAIEFAAALQHLHDAVTKAKDSNIKQAGLALHSKLDEVYFDGKIPSKDLPLYTQMALTGVSIASSDPGSEKYNVAVNKFSRLTNQVIGTRSLGRIIGGIALMFLGAAIIAGAVALAFHTGGFSLGLIGVGIKVIAGAAVTVGLANTTAVAVGAGAGGACLVGGGLLSFFGRKREVAEKGDKFLEAARNQPLPLLS